MFRHIRYNKSITYNQTYNQNFENIKKTSLRMEHRNFLEFRMEHRNIVTLALDKDIHHIFVRHVLLKYTSRKIS